MKIWWILVLTGLAIILYAKWFIKDRMPDKVDKHAGSFMTKEVEKSMDTFASHLQQENERLFQKLKQMKEQMDDRIQLFEQRLESLEQRYDHVDQNGSELNEWNKNVDKNKLNLRERYEQVFALYDQNLSITDIAKQTGINEGEIKLIVKLADKEEETIRA